MGLDYTQERYVRLFVRDTTSWKMGPWQARAMLPQIMRKLDRAGVLDLGEDGVEALAVMTDMPLDVTEIGLAWWIKRGTLKLIRGNLVMPNFLEAQEAPQEDAQRARESRARKRDRAMAEEAGLVTKRDGDNTKRDDRVVESWTTSPGTKNGSTPAPARVQDDVTNRDDDSTKRDGDVTKPDDTVTAGHNQSLCAVPSRTVPSLAVLNRASETTESGASPVVSTTPPSLPASELRLWGALRIEHYQSAAAKALGRTWAFDKKQLQALYDLIAVHCVDKTRIELWIDIVVPAFVEATKEDEPKFWSSHQPRGLAKWLNEGGARKVANGHANGTGSSGVTRQVINGKIVDLQGNPVDE